MRTTFCLFLLLFSIGSVSSQKKLRASDKSLDSLFQVLLKDPESLRNQEEFFRKFPRSFKVFSDTYLYNTPMNSFANKHIFDGFSKLNKISDWKYYKRLIDLSIGGKWDTDAISYLQMILEIKAKEKPAILFSLLSLYPKEEIYSFWYFYFNSLLPLKGGLPLFLKEMEKEYPTVYEQLQKAFHDSDGQAICPVD